MSDFVIGIPIGIAIGIAIGISIGIAIGKKQKPEKYAFYTEMEQPIYEAPDENTKESTAIH